MIKVENIEVMNFKSAFRGMRNPLESWKKADSIFGVLVEYEYDIAQDDFTDLWCDEISSDSALENFQDWYTDNGILQYDEHALEIALLGPEDLALAQKLIIAGSDHSKFMRQIFVTMDITAPLYWWKEMDQYRVGCTTNSESTMHKLATTPITRDCFSFDNTDSFSPLITDLFDDLIQDLEKIRKSYLETKDIRYWRALIQLLPSSWNQTRTWTANYAVLRNIYFARSFHKLSEWREFCKIIEDLPYGEELICVTQNDMQPEKKYRVFLEK